MNNDLISRRVVKELISDKSIPIKFEKEKRGDWQTSLGVILSDIDNVIDNAPTVEPCYQTTSCLDCKNYDKENYYCPRFCEVIREIAKENQRPQGEWIEGTQGYYCSECETIDRFYFEHNFCPNCGASMKKGGVE